MFTTDRLLTVSGSQKDPYFNNVTLLVHAEGANGSTTLVDSSNQNTTLYRDTNNNSLYGNQLYISTARKKFGQSSIYSYGCPNIYGNVDRRHTGNFTIEFFVNIVDSTFGSYGGGCLYSIGKENTGRVNFGFDEVRNIFVDFYNSGNYLLCPGSSINLNTWYHIAIVRNGTNLILYKDGVQTGSKTNVSGTLGNSLGFYFAGDNWYEAEFYMDEVRVTDAVCRYTTGFIPPSKQFPDQ